MVSLDLKQAAPSRVCLIGGERLRGQGKVEEAYQLRHDSTKNRNTFMFFYMVYYDTIIKINLFYGK